MVQMQINDRIKLPIDLPDHNLKAGAIATVIGFVSDKESGKSGVILRCYTAQMGIEKIIVLSTDLFTSTNYD